MSLHRRPSGSGRWRFAAFLSPNVRPPSKSPNASTVPSGQWTRTSRTPILYAEAEVDAGVACGEVAAVGAYGAVEAA